jgi:hypothetical protein
MITLLFMLYLVFSACVVQADEKICHKCVHLCLVFSVWVLLATDIILPYISVALQSRENQDAFAACLYNKVNIN